MAFDRRLGHTHAMGPVEADVLELLWAKPTATPHELMNTARALTELPPDARAERLAQALAQLGQLRMLPDGALHAARR